MVIDNKDKNIFKTVSDVADRVIQDLSGGAVVHRQKVIDNVIAVTGAAGGVGTSTVVANMAYVAMKKGFTVLVIDMNIVYPVQHIYFGVKQVIDRKDLVSFLLGKNTIGQSIESIGDISLLVANNRTIMDSINCDNEICSKNFDEAIERIRPLFDLIIMDCPVDLQLDVINNALYKADKIYSVWDESISCISNIERIRRNMVFSGIEAYNKLKVIFNKRTSIHYPKYPFEKLNLELMVNLPFELAVIESGLRGEIFCDKGSSLSRNAAIFVKEMDRLVDKVVRIGGYRE